MSGTTTTILDPMMKVLTEEPLFVNMYADSDLLDLWETDDRIAEDTTTGGRYIERAHILGPPTGVGARREGDNMPEAEDPTSVNSRIYLRSLYGRIEMSGHTMRRVVNDAGSFTNWAVDSFEYFSKYTLAPEVDRILIGYGAAVKAVAEAAMSLVSGTTYTLDLKNAYGISGFEDAWLQFVENERIVFAPSVTSAAAALRNAGTAQSCKVSDIDEANDRLTLTGVAAGLAAAVVTNDVIFPGDAAGFSGSEGGAAREPLGLLAAVDDGDILATYLNITRADNRKFRAHNIDVSSATYGWGGVFNEDAISWGDQQVSKSMGGKIDYLLVSTNASRSYWKSQKAEAMWMNRMALATQGGKPEPMAIKLGDRSVAFKIIRKLPPSVAFGITKSTFKLFTLKKWQWDNMTGAIWNRVVTSSGVKDQFYAIGFTDFELANHFPRLNIRWDGIASVY